MASQARHLFYNKITIGDVDCASDKNAPGRPRLAAGQMARARRDTRYRNDTDGDIISNYRCPGHRAIGRGRFSHARADAMGESAHTTSQPCRLSRRTKLDFPIAAWLRARRDSFGRRTHHGKSIGRVQYSISPGGFVLQSRGDQTTWLSSVVAYRATESPKRQPLTQLAKLRPPRALNESQGLAVYGQ